MNYLFDGSPNRLLLRSPERISLYDVNARKILREVQVLRYPVKFVRWAPNYKKVAMLTRYSVVICNNDLNNVSTIFENSKVKSGTWIPVFWHFGDRSTSGGKSKSRKDKGVVFFFFFKS